jgi:DNA-binding NarL/FixJ family response regulator
MKKFFVVDDDTDDRELFAEALAEVSPESICYKAVNGRKAIAALEQAEIEMPDFIFLDINMPVMYEEDIEKAQRLGALCFFTKTSNFNELKNTLRLLVDYNNEQPLVDVLHNSRLYLAGFA